jgi:subtilisin family serine protease
MRTQRRAAKLLASALLLAGSGVAGATQPAGDPLISRQWGLSQIHAPQAWAKSTGRGVLVAVVDEGVDGTHPDLAGQVLPGKDFVHGAARAWDDIDGHGTAVAGIVAALRNNGAGIAGVAPNARILPVKVGESGVYTAVERGVTWAADHGAKVIVLSIGLQPGFKVVNSAVPAISDPLRAAIDHAWRKGAVIVAAAGNNSEPYCTEPADFAHVLCVGAVDKRGLHPSWSNADVAMSASYLVAPGGSDLRVSGTGLDELIWTTSVPFTGTQPSPAAWGEEAGTSFAAPFVGGVAAMLAARGLTNAQITAKILSTATDLGPAGRDPVFGYGEVDAARAVG